MHSYYFSGPQKEYNYVTTATTHSTLAKHNQPSADSGTDTKEPLEEYMDMTESSRARALSGSTKEQPEEYMEMNGNNKGIRQADQELEEYMEMTGEAQDSNKVQEDGSMYVDLETVQDYEVPVNRKKPSSSDLTYL
jgi:succinate dehydrogenase/fumarate reductase flavoprotein subunit